MYHYDSTTAAVDYDALMTSIARLEKVGCMRRILQAE
jgi:hypothetical protein